MISIMFIGFIKGKNEKEKKKNTQVVLLMEIKYNKNQTIRAMLGPNCKPQFFSELEMENN